MRVLVSGSGGYIGIPLCHALVRAGHEVTALDRYFFGKRPDGCEIVTGDTRTVADMPKILSPMMGIDAVIDLAGLSNDASADIDPDLTTSINKWGAIKLMDAAQMAGVRRYVYSSSASVYGATDGIADEDHPIKPLTRYAQSKADVERVLLVRQIDGFEPVILRNATVFGYAPRMRLDLAVNIMTYRAMKEGLIYLMGGGAQWRPFIHVNDVVRAMVWAVEAPAEKVASHVFNVGFDSQNHTIADLAQMVHSRYPSARIHRIPDDPDARSYRLSCAKFAAAIGDWAPNQDVGSGIVDVEWAHSDGSFDGSDPTCYTLQWYKSLLEWNERIEGLKLNGRLL